MKISYNWLRHYVDFDLEPDELARKLTSSGLEVEDYEKTEAVKGGLKGVCIGLVVECEKHPNADKLSVTKVDTGMGRLLSIVCGAPNVRAGQKVPVATVGAILYSGEKSFEIKEAKIRGEFSEGMICAEDELGLGTSHEGIMVLDPDARIGMPAAEYFRISEDYIFEIGLTPNRTDATSHVGVARDLVAILNRAAGERKYTLKRPSVDEFVVDNHDLVIPVTVEDVKACPRYSGITISGIKVAESPDWMKNLLNAAGIRPISNVVDVTNFVMMELGQPLHAFDASRIRGGKVVVRKASNNELFVTLDQVERKLSGEDLLICNEFEGMCIAGVFGGAESGVNENTTSIFLESACFSPQGIRKTSRRHGLQTDSSFRFERGSDPNITVFALKRAALLIRELAGGTISSDIVDIYAETLEPCRVTATWKNIFRLIGKEIDHLAVKSILTDLGIEISGETPDGMDLLIPTFKTDVTREADVIEEILRIYGYDNIEMPGHLRSSLSFSSKPDIEKIRNLISDMLSSLGFNEIMNNSLTRSRYAEESGWLRDDDSVRLMNPLSADLNVMRQSLLFGGLETIAYNQNRKSFDLRLFEFGRVYRIDRNIPGGKDTLTGYDEHEQLSVFITGRVHPESWRTKEDKTDYFDLKSIVHLIMERIGINPAHLQVSDNPGDPFQEGQEYTWNHQPVIRFGLLKKKETKRFDLKQDVYFADFNWDKVLGMLSVERVSYSGIPKFPEVRRDLALVIDQAVTYTDLEKTAFETEKKLLRNVSLFDVYQGEKIAAGKKSYALSFILRDDEKTLTDDIIERSMNRILKAFEEKFRATLR